MKKQPPKVRMAKPKGRPIQLRYTCPVENREIRISTGTHDESQAEGQKKELEAKLLLGQDAKPRKRSAAGPNMPWQEFRDRYSDLKLVELRNSSRRDAESRLDVVERILKPKTLSDLASSEALQDLKNRLHSGEESRTGLPRSSHTVKTYMANVSACLNFAAIMGWLEVVPKVIPIKTSKLRHMKGRPITGEEFDRMVAATECVVGEAASDSWKRVLWGLWESGLRLGELLNVHWTDKQYIVPAWGFGPYPVLSVPAPMQKNDTEEEIPMLPRFEQVLLETPEDARDGWAFNPRATYFFT
ncbi:hypothetical protein [Adhaeretor mobilis]|uniref:Core-binding (CB) domain-containing protein n=1 Tax=Adhaeretor mobilis TaxID=1930276 RepID=A0A517MW74_9BACT|nr:hypothetical protein [Adhaeretor mobilis]QDS99047.1 hypothetical protein HG15A2_23370 [Adhaeretor mobilis]